MRKFDTLCSMDKLWKLLIMYCIGEQFEDSKYITGIRVVDSSIPCNRRMLHKIELWFSDLGVRESIEKKFRDILNIDACAQVYFKEHSNAVESKKNGLKKQIYNK